MIWFVKTNDGTTQKTNKSTMAKTILGETKKGEAKERPKDAEHQGPKKRERTSLFHGRELSHPQAFLCHHHANHEI